MGVGPPWWVWSYCPMDYSSVFHKVVSQLLWRQSSNARVSLVCSSPRDQSLAQSVAGLAAGSRLLFQRSKSATWHRGSVSSSTTVGSSITLWLWRSQRSQGERFAPQPSHSPGTLTSCPGDNSRSPFPPQGLWSSPGIWPLDPGTSEYTMEPQFSFKGPTVLLKPKGFRVHSRT